MTTTTIDTETFHTNSWEFFSSLLDCDQESCVFIKDRQRRFVWMNSRMLTFVGADPKCYVGTSDWDYFPPDLTRGFIAEDERVMGTRQKIHNLPQIVTDHTGQWGWFMLNKLPIIDRRNMEVIGLIGMLRDYTRLSETVKPLHEMRRVIAYILREYSSGIRTEDLAKMVYLSVSQFNRRFKQMFSMSPNIFIQRVRIDSAMRLLIESDYSITKIAHECGFYDSSSFASRFRKRTGMSPRDYRKHHKICQPDRNE